MRETSQTSAFGDLHRPGARLIRCTDPPSLSTLAAGDMVICEDGWGVDDWTAEATEKGVHVRTGAYRFETEKVFTRGARSIVAADYPPALLDTSKNAPPAEISAPPAVEASTAAFAATWDTLSAEITRSDYEPANAHVPEGMVPYLPYPTLNPAQVQAAPTLLSDRPLLVVAPTGAGKTVMGMIAVLREVKMRGGRAVWLVPQRSLTAELDRDLDAWRQVGIRVVTLSGETTVDAARTQDADVWVATTEKFEALCRASSMREAIRGIGTVVVDEIHLLGDPTRGPILEAVLARLRGVDSGVRLVGLSATAVNAHEVADWLSADLIRLTWRPTRQTTQVLAIPPGDRNLENRHRSSMAAAIAREVSASKGSTLVFCGTKANVRHTALAIAADRGVKTGHIDLNHLEVIQEACARAGVGLHYSDWPGKHESERLFRERRIDVLVATSTLAAGVNTPARVVVVRDTAIGPQPMEVSTVQQMFGRAGRAGQEPEGWSFLITEGEEVAQWRNRLSAGYTIRSGLLAGLADHVLGEVVQQRINGLSQAEAWWLSTFAHHQGSHALTPLHEARNHLIQLGFITTEPVPDGEVWKATAVGSLVARMMVGVSDAASLITALARTRTPANHGSAEDLLIQTIATSVGSLANTPDAPEEQSPQVRRLIAARGHMESLASARVNSPAGRSRASGSEVSTAGLMLAARSPQALAGRGRQIAGVDRSRFNPALFDSSRYFAWLAAVGPLGVVPAWAAIVAADLGQRVEHYRLAPKMGDGRVLRIVSKLSRGSDTTLRQLWREAAHTGHGMWPFTARPDGASPAEYEALRSTHVTLHLADGALHTSPGAAVFQEQRNGRQSGWVRTPPNAAAPADTPVAAFGPRGDWAGLGWLARFSGPDAR